MWRYGWLIALLGFSFSAYSQREPILGSISAQCVEQYAHGNFEKALYYCHLASGHPEAQFILGKIYSVEGITSIEMQKAYEYFSLAANQNHPLAQFTVALCYQNGLGVPQSSSAAARWYNQARVSGLEGPELKTQLTRDMNTFLLDRLSNKTESLQIAAENGLPEAEYQLGLLYAVGKDLPQDDGKAWVWLKRAARQNHFGAQSYLAWMSLLGIGKPESTPDAIKWFLLAQQQTLDTPKAASSEDETDNNIVFIHRPAQSEFTQGQQLLETSLSNEDKADGLTLLEKAAEENYAPAQLYLAKLYHQGEWVKKDLSRAVEWYTQAAYNGNAEAQYALGWMYFYGEGVLTNQEEAFEWFHRANKQEKRAKAAMQFVEAQNPPTTESLPTASHESPPSLKRTFNKMSEYLKAMLPARKAAS